MIDKSNLHALSHSNVTHGVVCHMRRYSSVPHRIVYDTDQVTL